nr:hypothetical protein [Tanacetum cinerariifolium]
MNPVATQQEEDLPTFIMELGYSGKCGMLSTIRTDQMHQPWRTFAAIINKCTLKFVSKTEDYHKYGALIPDGMINEDMKLSTAYKTYLAYATRKVTPKDTHDKSVTKKKAPAKAEKGKVSRDLTKNIPNSENVKDEQLKERVCKAKKFDVMKDSLGPNKEYIAINTSECNAWTRNKECISHIYQEIFLKKVERGP